MPSNLTYPLSLNQIDQIRPAGLEATVVTRDRTLATHLLEPGVVVSWAGRAYGVTHVSAYRDTETLTVEHVAGSNSHETMPTQFTLHLTAELQL